MLGRPTVFEGVKGDREKSKEIFDIGCKMFCGMSFEAK